MRLSSLCLPALLAMCCTAYAGEREVPIRTLELPPGPGNPRNSEGAFVSLKDGRILFIYSHYTAGHGADHDPAQLCGRYSSDGGRTWSAEDRLIVENEGGMNVMSVSLLRLQGGEIALFYLRKNSEKDCRPVMRLSTDEGETWGPPMMCITDEIGYYVLNNDRVIQLKSGRLVAPVCLHTVKDSPEMDRLGTVMCYLSDDSGRSWRRSRSTRKGYDTSGERITIQEPGVVELKDGRIMMLMRASGGYQYLSYSEDGGETWSPPHASALASPISPASIKRLPSTGDLLLVWNDHSHIPSSLRNRRVPLSVAISQDEGQTWQHIKVLEGNPEGWYCYTAVHPLDDAVLLGYCASRLAHLRVTRVPVAWLYRDEPITAAVKDTASLFAGAPEGPLQQLQTPLGVWSADVEHAEVYSYARGKGIRIQGGTNRTVILTPPQPVSYGALTSLRVERFTARNPYEFIVEALVGETWHRVWQQGETTTVGQLHPIDLQVKELQASQFRFQCTSVLGAIIADMSVPSLGGFFRD
ncbi:MAG: sialidase family protein [Limnochordia bacterium]